MKKKVKRGDRWKDACEFAWTLIANVGNGDWTNESEDWQKAACNFRDYCYYANLDMDKFGKVSKDHKVPKDSKFAKQKF